MSAAEDNVSKGGRVRARVIGKSSGRLAHAQAEVHKLTTGGGKGIDSLSNVQIPDEEKMFNRAGAIEPPWDPRGLNAIFRNSNALRQAVDAMAQNIDGFGHRFEPVFDFDDKEDIDEKIADALIAEKEAEAKRTLTTFDEDYEPTKKEIADAKKRIQKRMRRELNRAKCFFDFACSSCSFADLRKQTRVDQESIGQAYWEVRRTLGGEIIGFEFAPSFTIRAVRVSPNEVIEREVPVQNSPMGFEQRRELHRAHRWIQVIENRDPVYFKEFLDPRIISNRSGRPYESIEALRDAEPEAMPATELIQFRIPTAESALYGAPRWAGNLKSALGSIKAEQVNLMYFDNKAVPPMAVMVSGGSLSEETVSKLENFIENDIKGSDNYHKILLLEAEPFDGDLGPLNSGKVRIEMVPLTKAIHNDALFMKYDEANRSKIWQSMRIPPILVGDTRNFNRATADAAISFAEEQVFEPERRGFDWFMNRFILPPLDIRYLKFASNSPVTTDLDAAKAIHDLTKVGVLTPKEARRLVARVFNEELKQITADWVEQPLQMTLAGIMMGEDGSMTSAMQQAGNQNEPPQKGNEPPSKGSSTGRTEREVEAAIDGDARKMYNVIKNARRMGVDVVDALSQIFQIRDEAREKEHTAAMKEFEAAKALKESEPEVIEVTIDSNGDFARKDSDKGA